MANRSENKSVENRLFPRNQLKLSASFSTGVNERSRPCIINDFCEGGLFFTSSKSLSQSQDRNESSVRGGNTIYLEFQCEGRFYKFACIAVRIMGDSIAVRFLEQSSVPLPL